MIWIGLTAMIGTIVVSLALLRSWRGDALGIPLVAIGSFAFLYVIQPVQLIRTDSIGLFLSDWQVTKALLVPALMLACFMWGWLRPVRQRPLISPSWDPHTLWNFGFGAACIGLVLFIIFLERSGGITASYSQAHGGAMNWQNNTAYLYDGPWIMLSGSAMMIIAEARSRNRRWKTCVSYSFLALYLANAILGGSRGPTFAVTTAAFVCYSIARYKQVKFRHTFVVLVLVGCAVAIVFANRERLHLGAQARPLSQSPEQNLDNLVDTSESSKEHGTVSQEFLYHASMLETVDQTGKLDYGVSWITYLVINPIPRLLWPDKALPPTTGITNGDIRAVTSITPDPGAAPGFAADLYTCFQLFSAVFCFGLGYALRRLYTAARTLNSTVASVGYVMIFALSLNMFAQGFSAIFVPFLYSMVPVVLFAWTTGRGRKRVEARRREIVLQRVAIHREQWLS